MSGSLRWTANSAAESISACSPDVHDYSDVEFCIRITESFQFLLQQVCSQRRIGVIAATDEMRSVCLHYLDGQGAAHAAS